MLTRPSRCNESPRDAIEMISTSCPVFTVSAEKTNTAVLVVKCRETLVGLNVDGSHEAADVVFGEHIQIGDAPTPCAVTDVTNARIGAPTPTTPSRGARGIVRTVTQHRLPPCSAHCVYLSEGTSIRRDVRGLHSREEKKKGILQLCRQELYLGKGMRTAVQLYCSSSTCTGTAIPVPQCDAHSRAWRRLLLLDLVVPALDLELAVVSW